MCTSDRLVIDIGEVHHAADRKAALLQMTLEKIFEDVSAEVADVGIRVDGRTAGVEREIPSLAGTRGDLLQPT